MSLNEKTTPLMKQYNRIKAKYPDTMLLFRVGDFYETFGEDAIVASEILNIVLTHRNNGNNKIELAGFPHHSINTYLPKLIKAGKRVAVCDQLEDPKQTKGVVKRGVTELVTPGMTLNDNVLTSKKNNFLCAIYFGKQNIGVSFLDISTGEFLTTQGTFDEIDQCIQKFSPSEIIISKSQKKKYLELFSSSTHLYYIDDWVYSLDYTKEKLTSHFQTKSLQGYGIENKNESIITSGTILYYISENHQNKYTHITTIKQITNKHYVWMDKFTIRNLEIYPNPDRPKGSLLDIMDSTLTAMGGRILRRWFTLPLKHLGKIKKRHDAVGFFKDNINLTAELRRSLKQIMDIERISSRIATHRINPRELNQLKDSLKIIQDIETNFKDYAIKEYISRIEDSTEVISLLENTLMKEAPMLLSKGNVINEGVSEKLDEYRNISNFSKNHLQKILEKEIADTGIFSLKINKNNVFGYYIEVRNTHKDKVPQRWIRKQTLANAERYVTEELKEYENKIFTAQDQISIIEQQLYQELIERLQQYLLSINKNASIIAILDALSSFGQIAFDNNYNLPEINESKEINIKDGRHPIIEKHLNVDENYIANDVFFDKDQQIIIITGPNMSGKSAILRQVALIVFMAQIGSFVPANKANIGWIDKIFTRVGASDNISTGESTFMVEMNETALIMNNLSERSLILLDEIGRGTSTYDGISIAWAITEYLHQCSERPKTMFATHYHELNEMTNTFERIKNFNVSVKQTQSKILFLRKLVAGGSHHSFGIQVAKMSGIPQEIIKKAEDILKRLEKTHDNEHLQEKLESITPTENKQPNVLEDIEDEKMKTIKEKLLAIDLEAFTPIEAIIKIDELKKIINS